MQNFNPLALKLSEEIEDDGQTYCKNAKSSLQGEVRTVWVDVAEWYWHQAGNLRSGLKPRHLQATYLINQQQKFPALACFK